MPFVFVVTNGSNNWPSTFAGRPVPASRTDTSTASRRDLVAHRDAAPVRRRVGHRVHGVHHEVDEHLLQEHLIAGDDARLWRQFDVDLDLPRPRVVRHQRHALAHDGMDVDWLLVQLTVPEHRPMPLDDLCGADVSRADVRQDLPQRFGCGAVGRDQHLACLRVVHDRVQRLAELVRDRVRSARTSSARRLASAASARLRRLSHLGALSGAALVQQSDNQERLDGQRADGAQHRAPVVRCQRLGAR